MKSLIFNRDGRGTIIAEPAMCHKILEQMGIIIKQVTNNAKGFIIN